jgi:hypothetical protein
MSSDPLTGSEARIWTTSAETSSTSSARPPIIVYPSRSPDLLAFSKASSNQSGASAGGKRGIGYKRRALRCNKQSRYVGQGAGTVEIVQSGR